MLAVGVADNAVGLVFGELLHVCVTTAPVVIHSTDTVSIVGLATSACMTTVSGMRATNEMYKEAWQ
jgi:hypothetical protein